MKCDVLTSWKECRDRDLGGGGGGLCVCACVCVYMCAWEEGGLEVWEAQGRGEGRGRVCGGVHILRETAS